MATEVTMPQMGADMTEGVVVRWLKQVGDEIKRGEIIAEIETDKATVELEAFESGTLKQIVVEEGETVPVGEVIAILGEAVEEVGAPPERLPSAKPADRHIDQRPSEKPAEKQQAADEGPPGAQPAQVEAEEKSAPQPDQRPAATKTAERPAPEPGRAETDGRLRISPVARRIASDAGIDPSQITGSGPDGRILRRDVEAAVAQAKGPAAGTAVAAGAPSRAAPPAGSAAAGPFDLQPLTRMRQAIARRMSQSKQWQPHYYLTLDVDMTDAMAFRKQFNEAAGEERRASINDLIVKACAIALERHPKFNGEFSEQGIKVYSAINIAVGVALDDGLIAPALLDVGNKSLGVIANEAKDLFERARSGKLSADEYSAGTFTITNLGAFGVETLVGIINPPQAANLGVGSVMPAPVVRDNQVVVRQVMKVALSADHRVTDGAEGARFIKEIQALLENPASLAL